MSTYSYSFADSKSRTKHFFYRVIGYLLLSLSVAQLLTTAVSFGFGERAFWNFLLSTAITASSGLYLVLRSGGAVQLKSKRSF